MPIPLVLEALQFLRLSPKEQATRSQHFLETMQ